MKVSEIAEIAQKGDNYELYRAFYNKVETFREELQDFVQFFLSNPFTEFYKCTVHDDGNQGDDNNSYLQLVNIVARCYCLKEDARKAYDVLYAMQEFADRSEDLDYLDE